MSTHPYGAHGRHPARIAHLVAGLVFLGVTVAWALWTGDVVGGDDIAWLLPIPLLIAGTTGLAVIAAGAVRKPQHAQDRDDGLLPLTDVDTDADPDTDMEDR